MPPQEQVHRHRQQRLIGVRPEGVEKSRRGAAPPAHPTITAVEGGLAVFTMISLALYVPIETYASVRGTGVLRLSYLVDLVGMGLLAAGVVALWRGRPSAGSLIATGWAWTAANFWRATMERYQALEQGHGAFLGSFGVWVGGAVTLCSIAAVGVAVWVAVRHDADARL